MVQDLRDHPVNADTTAVMSAFMKIEKTHWFWLTMCSVVALLVTETLVNWLMAEKWLGEPRDIIPVLFVFSVGTALAVFGSFGQYAAYRHKIGWMENLLTEYDTAEGIKHRREEQERRRVQNEAERLRLGSEEDARKSEAETERLRQQIALEEQKERVERETRLRERAEEERRSQKQKEQDDLRSLLERRKAEAEARKKEAKKSEKEAEPNEKTEDDGRPRFDPNDLQRTARWGFGIVEKLQKDADNAIRHRATLEKLSKDISVYEDTKVRWSFVVVSIKEDRVELMVTRNYGTAFSSSTGASVFVTDANRRYGHLALRVGEGISEEKAAKLKPGDTITVAAKVASLTLRDMLITIVLKEMRAAEAGKQSRKEQEDEKETPKLAVGNSNLSPAPHSRVGDSIPPLSPPVANDRRTSTPRSQTAAEQRATVERERQGRLVVEERLGASEEELRKQLAAVPELRLVNDLDVQAIHKSAGGESVMVELHQQMVKAGIREGLPVRAGAQARLLPSAAMVVEQLSKSLRDMGFVSGVPSPGTFRGLGPSQENRPLDKTAEFQKWCDDKQIEKTNAALPILLQMLQVEKPPLRRVLVRELAKVNNRDTTIVLTYRALFDLDREVRDLAVKSLEKRSSNQYLPILLKGLRYPWPPVADRAALALRKLKTTGVEPQLIKLLEQPSPSLPILDKKKKKWFVPEIVRLNHMRNCLLCHTPSMDSKDGLVRGLVPTPGEPLPRVYYEGQSGNFIRADTTLIRQDFSIMLTIEGAAPWPAEQRFDFVVRTRVVNPDEMPEIATKQGNNYPQRGAVLYALRGITGKDAGESADKWRQMLGIARDTDAGLEKMGNEQTASEEKVGARRTQKTSRSKTEIIPGNRN